MEAATVIDDEMASELMSERSHGRGFGESESQLGVAAAEQGFKRSGGAFGETVTEGRGGGH